MRRLLLAALALGGLSTLGGAFIEDPTSASFQVPRSQSGGTSARQKAGLPEALLNHDVAVMNSDGSNQRNLTKTVADELGPVWSPDGSRIAYYTNSVAGGSSEVFAMDADGGHKRNLTRNRAFDGSPAWSPDGRRIAFSTDRGPGPHPLSEIFVMNPDGSDQRNLTRTVTSEEWSAAWSPDGRKIAFVSGRTGNNDIFVMNGDGSGQTNLTRSQSQDQYPVWSPDGSRIAFESLGRTGGTPDIVVINADGSGQTDLTPDIYEQRRPRWSPDSTRIVFQGYGWYGKNDIYVMKADGSAKTNLTPENPDSGDGGPAWSPDDRRIAYGAYYLGVGPRPNREILSMNPDGSGKTNLTRNRAKDDFPIWSPDGHKIAFTRRSPVCRVPYVIDRSLAVARARIRQWNCALGGVRYRRSARKRGLVLEMRPRPGRLLLFHTRVSLVVSRGT